MKLKVADEKLTPEGVRFKCPKCSTVLLVKKPSVQIKPLENKVIVAHENPAIVERVKNLLSQKGYSVTTSYDGIDVMIKAVKELPFLTILDVVLPKIYGFEVCKRLKERPETKAIKVILISSIYDKTRYRREPISLYGADDYIEEHRIEEQLIDKIETLRGIKKKEEVIEKPPLRFEAPVPREIKIETDEAVEKAKRLARTIVSDIYLYSSAKMEGSIKNNTFYSDFASEIKEGMKLYQGRVPAEVRGKGDFFREAIDNFIENKKKTLKI
jgi:CheY-like chemotaxis protein